MTQKLRTYVYVVSADGWEDVTSRRRRIAALPEEIEARTDRAAPAFHRNLPLWPLQMVSRANETGE